MTAAGLLDGVSSRELTEWNALYRLEAEEHRQQLAEAERARQAAG